MGTGILICGLNGCGKSTLGRALAKALGFYRIDNEELYFSRSDESAPYANARSREEVERLFLDKVCAHGDFVFCAVRGDYGEVILPKYDYAVLVEAERETRLRRVRERSFQKFGARMQPGGDLYESEEAFFRQVASRPEDDVELWVRTLNCPIIRVDGTKAVEENVERIILETGLKKRI